MDKRVEAAASTTSLWGALLEMRSRMHRHKYKPSFQEAYVWEDCMSTVDKYFVRGFVSTGCLLWPVTSQFKLLSRLTIATVGATIGARVAIKGAVKSCLEDIISLDGSWLQQELSTILLRDHAHNPLVRKLLRQRYYLERVYDDSCSSVPSLRLCKRTFSGEEHDPIDTISESAYSMEESKISEQNFSNQQTRENVSDRDNALIKPYVDIPNSKMKMHGDRQIGQGDEKMAEGSDFSLDSFSIFKWGTSGEEASKQRNEGQTLGRRRKRMTANERRQYNRERYLQWKQRQHQTGS